MDKQAISDMVASAKNVLKAIAPTSTEPSPEDEKPLNETRRAFLTVTPLRTLRVADALNARRCTEQQWQRGDDATAVPPESANTAMDDSRSSRTEPSGRTAGPDPTTEDSNA